MAPKKKTDTDDVEKAKSKLAKDARAVGQAADRLLRLPVKDDEDFGIGAAWDKTKGEVEDMDREFLKMNSLKQKLERGDIGVRVMQIGPDGKLIDVSDRISPKSDSASENRNPRTKAEALKLLQTLLPGLRTSDLQAQGSGFGNSATSESIRRMEMVLAESDKILEHWKK